MNKIALSTIFALGLLVFSPEVVLAEDGKKDARRSLSQLDFDEAYVDEALPAQQISEEDPNAIKLQQLKALVKKSKQLEKDAKKGEARARLTIESKEKPKPAVKIKRDPRDVVKAVSKNTLLKPAEAVDSDAGSDSTITTANFWLKEEGSCAFPKNNDNRHAKSEALRELFYRFSGSNDIHDNTCKLKCKTIGEKPKLLGLSVISTHGGTFNFVEMNEVECHYKLTKTSDAEWQTLQGARSTCACM